MKKLQQENARLKKMSAEERLSDEDALIADGLLRPTYTNRRWGFGLCFLYLRIVHGMRFNRKLPRQGDTAKVEFPAIC